MHCRSLPSLLVAALLLGVVPADAATTSRLEGKVVDDQGGPLADVQVTIRSESLIGGPQSTTSDAEGGFAFNLLPVGEYVVEATLLGYAPAAAVVPVQLDRTASVTLPMVSASFSEEIAVGAEVPIIDTTRTSTGEVFDEKYLQQSTIGSDRRWFALVKYYAAGGGGPGVPGVFGATLSENTYLVDGFNTTDSASGGSATRFAFDAVEEASMLTGGLDAEFGFGTGGVVNVVTKSGGNRFSGTFDARYRDQGFNESGDHYDPDVEPSSNRLLSATLGGPILRDRLWFFAAVENGLEEETPVGAPVTTTSRRDSYLGKITWAINPAHRLAARHSTTPQRVEYFGAASYTTPEGTQLAKGNEPISQLILDSLLSESALLTVGLGFNREYSRVWPMINDVDTPPEADLDAYILFSNPDFTEGDDRYRDHHRAKISYFLGDTSGSHQLDLGLEYHRLPLNSFHYTPGGYLLYYFNNGPDYWDGYWPDNDGDGLVDVQLDRDAPPETARDWRSSKADGWSAFIQDQWRPLSQLTVRLGLRYDTMAHTNAVGVTVADFEKWLPRVGVAWDVGGHSDHVLRAAWGRTMHPGTTNLSWFVPGIARGTEVYLGLDYLCGAPEIGICDRATAVELVGPELIHVDADGDEHPFYLAGSSAELPAETVDTLGVGRLRAPYRDELILAYEARLAHETSVELSYVRKDFHDQIEDTCANNTWAWADGAPPSLDDPSTWTDEAACTGSVRTNLTGLRRDYEAFILRAASRARSWFHLVGSYTYSKTRGNNASQPWFGFGSGFSFPRGDFDSFPTSFVNRDGNLGDDIRHWVKLNGYLQLPLDITLGIGADYRSGAPLDVATDCLNMFSPSESGLAELERLGIDYDEMRQYCQSPISRLLYLEPRGSRRAPATWQLDLQLSKGFRLGNLRLLGIVSAFNVFSEETPAGFTTDPFHRLGWGATTGWQQPRRYEAGLRVEF